MRRSPRIRPRLALAPFLLLCPCLHAQSPTVPSPPPTAATSPAPPSSFEVASIRLAEDHSAELLAQGIQPMSWSTFPTDRFYARNMSLSVLLSFAFNIEGKYIRSAPAWAETQLYNIEAKPEGNQQLTYEQMLPLLQNLLAERLHLATHRKTEMTSGFDLVLAKGGPKLQPAQGTRKPSAAILADGIQAWSFKSKDLCSVLAHPAGKPVADRTGLTGTYDMKLSFAPPGDPNSPLPDFFTAIQDQLGLKLIPAKVPVETLIIDHVDRTPADN